LNAPNQIARKLREATVFWQKHQSGSPRKYSLIRRLGVLHGRLLMIIIENHHLSGFLSDDKNYRIGAVSLIVQKILIK
jgi:hypothetical protein